MDEILAWSYRAKMEKARAALERNGFDARVADSAAEAADLVASFVKAGASVGFGGSMTLRALGTRERALALGARLLDHNAPGLSAADRLEMRRAQLTCDLFLASANAVTLDGALHFVDGSGNRVAALSFGPRKTVVVAGANKIVADETEASYRVKSVAGPMNNRRLQLPNPCVKSGTCADCAGHERICRIYLTLRRKPSASDFTVILVGESLGY